MKKFDFVVGNPPYNNDLYLDFVTRGDGLSSRGVCMITPAKWQAAEYNRKTNKNTSYRYFKDNFVPRMTDVKFFMFTPDAFDIQTPDGITYYFIGKQVVEQCKIENFITKDGLSNTKYRKLSIDDTLHNFGQELVDYLKDTPKFDFDVCLNSGLSLYNVEGTQKHTPVVDTPLVLSASRITQQYEVDSNNQHPDKNNKPCTIANSRVIKKYDANISDKMTMNTMTNPPLVFTPVRVEDKARVIWADGRLVSEFSNESKVIFRSDSLQECLNFVSWFNCKLVLFCVYINRSKLSCILTNDYFKYVPAPPCDTDGNYKFDHVYNDEELYKLYNIPDRLVNIIEETVSRRHVSYDANEVANTKLFES